MIRSGKETAWPSDILISDLESAALTVACVIRMRLLTLPNDLILRRLGWLAAPDRLLCARRVAEVILG